MLREGEEAPDFELPSSSGVAIRLSQFRGRNVVIFFYPKDGSPGCTVENCLIRDRLREFEELDSVVLGISRDSVESHRKFASRHGLAHYLLSDVVGDVIRRYGALGLFGITKRVTYIIDRQGRVSKIIRSLDPRRHVDEALDFLRVNLNL